MFLRSLLAQALTCLSALAIQTSNAPLFQKTIDAFLAIYNVPIGGDGLSIRIELSTATQLWFELIQRLLGIGAMAERVKAWDKVAYVIKQKGKGYDHEDYTNWFRHALTMAARANFLTDENQLSTTLINHAQAQVERIPCLRPDLFENDDELLNSLCRFDFLVSITSVYQGMNERAAKFYPNFARYRSLRSEPAAVQLLDDPALRQAVFPADDMHLADALKEVDRVAQQESSRVQGWGGYRNEQVRQFIEKQKVEQ